jgi:DNA-binding LytR/AlgR family response regulator
MIVHLDRIVQAHRYFNGRLKLDLDVKEDQDIIVSRSKCKSFLKWYGA